MAKRSRMVLFQFLIDPCDLEKLKLYSDDHGISVSSVIRYVISRYVLGKTNMDSIQIPLFQKPKSYITNQG